MTDRHEDAPHPLRSTLALLEREAARRAKGTPAGTTRLRDDELAALVALLRREAGTAAVETQRVTGR
ncbi:hypothetical protein [Lichenibacterium dinghuense]|uniref:hypothetical protein n=1 Tax=Lichenibacterium dinghuense TaxID=2895977 RepID=UPI001F1F4F9B|nr:hypothetical protein [Lichenibacterium sp. 6Y81]